MKALIIGAAGFVGGHLIEYLNSVDGIEVYATRLSNEKIESQHIKPENVQTLDILKKEQVQQVLAAIKPDYIFHLAAQSSVSLSWKEPVLTYNVNIIGTVNVLEAIRILQLKSRILLIGSAEEYGIIKPEDLPINESVPISPSNPYAISKTTQELTAKMYVGAYKLDIIMVRAFNHIGPGQSPAFVISDFAKQIAEIEKGKRDPVILVGNLNVKRDFTDVRDIVRGYWALIQSGNVGEIYNIGSGESYSISELLNKMIKMSSANISIKVDQDKYRPADIVELCGNINKIKAGLFWSPEIKLDVSLNDILDYWRAKC